MDLTSGTFSIQLKLEKDYAIRDLKALLTNGAKNT